jgi:5-methylcytosine-specific restriction protein A
VRRHVDELTDPTAVLRAIAECRELERDKFLRKYGYGRSTVYPLIHEDREYDSKAIAGVAFGIQHRTEPLKAKHDGNHGGMRTGQAGAVLKKLGFTIGPL